MKAPLTLLLLLFIASFTHAQDTVKVQAGGRLINYNGVNKVPVGLFGVHSTSLSGGRAERWGIELVRGIQAGPNGQPMTLGTGIAPAPISHLIDCWFDRFRPALLLENPSNWESNLTSLANTYVTSSLANPSRPYYLEFWNEPYLNWEDKPGVNFDPRFYDTTNAVVGGPVFLKNNPVPVKHAVWRRKSWFDQVVPATVSDYTGLYVATSSRWSQLQALPVGGELVVGSRTIRRNMRWVPDDTSTSSYYAGYMNAEYYIKMYRSIANTIKTGNPAVQMIAGWGQQFHQDNYNSFRLQFIPTIDSCYSLIDGLHEHHYGGDTRAIAAGYEVAWAYGKKYGRNFKMYNTEVGGFADPQVPGSVNPGRPSDQLVAARGALTYAIKDISYLITHCPDKAASRTAHEAHLNGGDSLAFKMLKPLRGNLLHNASSQSTVWSNTAVEGNRMTAFIFNDNGGSRNTVAKFIAPPGMSFTEGYYLFTADSGNGINMALRRSADFFINNTEYSDTFSFPQKSGRTYVFTLSGTLDSATSPTVKIWQFPSPSILETFGTGTNLASTHTINVNGNQLVQATAARLKLVVGTNGAGSTVSINGNTLGLPQMSYIQYLDVDPNWILPGNNTVTITASSSFRLLALSIELLSEPLPSLTSAAKVVAGKAVVYPNPFSQQLHITLPNGQQPHHIRLNDLSGKTVWSSPHQLHDTYQLPTLPAGAYLLQVEDVNGNVFFNRVLRW